MITDREEFVKICGILGYSDVHPTDGKYITSFIVELGKENEKLSKEVDVWNTKYNEVFDENQKLKGNNQSMQEEMCRTWEKLDKLNHNWNELKRQLQGRITVIDEVYLDNKEYYSDEMILDMTSRKWGYKICLDIMQELEEENK